MTTSEATKEKKPTQPALASKTETKEPTKEAKGTSGAEERSKKDKRERVKVGGGGGAWEGSQWFPMEPTPTAVARAAEYGNELVDDEVVSGRLYSGKAFDNKEIYFLRTEAHGDLLMPDHSGLTRDLAEFIEEHKEGLEIEIEYKGPVVVKNGKWKGKTAHAYDVFRLV